MRKILVLCCITLIILISNTAVAKESIVEISWPHAVYSGITQRANSLITQNDKEIFNEISIALTNRLHQFQGANTLPFALKEIDNSFEENKTVDGDITIIPLLLDDHAYISNYNIEGQDLFNAVLVCQMDILFCYQSSDGGALRCLYNIPLIGYKTLGPFSGGKPSKEFLRKEYADGIKQLINTELTFKNKSFLKDIELRKITPDTYQVTDVVISSTSANKFYGEVYPQLEQEDGIPLVKALIGASYTSSFSAHHPELTVFPSTVLGNWHKDAAKGTYRLSLSDSGKYIEQEEATNKIGLELHKLALFDIPPKDKNVVVYKYKGIVAEIKNLTDGQNALFTKVLQFQGVGDNSSQVKYPYESVFAEVLSGAAKELGGK